MNAPTPTHRRTRARRRPTTPALAWLALLALAAASTALAATPPIDTAELASDLRSIADQAVEVHPALAGAGARDAFLKHADGVIAQSSRARSAGDAAVLADLLLRPLDDPHSQVALASNSAEVLPWAFRWAVDGLVVSPLNGFDHGLPAAARVRTLGGRTPAELLDRLRALLPGNAAWLRTSAARVLPLAPVLRWLGAIGPDGTVAIEAEGADGRTYRARVRPLPRSALAGRAPPLRASLQAAVGLTADDWHRGATYLWRVEAATGTAHFWLLSCVDSSDYRASVQAFYEAAVRSQAKRVVIDLRFNGGGDSRVMEPLLAHLPAGPGLRYGVSVRASDAAARLRGLRRPVLALQAVGRDSNGLYVLSRPGTPRTPEPTAEPVYRGPVMVATGPDTFSSAGMIAVTLHDNGLATVVGEPTGAEPSGYGDVLRFRTRGLGITYTLSFKRFTRPDPAAGGGATLQPDVALPTTVDDLLQGRDPVSAWLAGRHD